MGREARAEEHRRDDRLEPSLPVAKRADADDQAADRDHPADVLGRVHVEVAAQLVVQERQREERQERREQAQAQLTPERPQAGGEPRRRHPQERAHRRERARAEQVRRAPVEAVQDELRDGRRVEGTPLERLRRHPPRVGQLEAVGPVSPRPEHLEVEERRAPQPDDGDRQEDDQARGDGEPILGQLLAQRLEVVPGAPAPQARRPQREGHGKEGDEKRRPREDVGDDEPGRGQADGRVAQSEGQRDPRRQSGPAGRVHRQHRSDPRDQHERGGRAEGRRAHSNTTQKSPAISQTVGSSKNEL